MKCLIPLFSLSLIFSATQANDLAPMMAVPGAVVLEKDFEDGAKLTKEEWQPRQRTQWQVKDGILLGQPSTAENQAARSHHKGLEARGSAPVTPMNFIAKLSIRYLEGKETPLTPFIEFGHHNCRVQFSKTSGAVLLVESETKQVAAAESFKFEPGKWYHMLAEMDGEDFAFQISGGPSFYTSNASFPKAPDHAIGVAGLRNSQIEIDNFTIWQTKPGERQKDWAQRKSEFPKTEPIMMQKRLEQLAKKKAAEAKAEK